MKKIASSIALLVLLLSTAFQCGDDVNCCDLPPCSELSTLTGTWRLQHFQNISTGVIDADPGIAGKSVVYTFQDNQKDGVITGNTFVNTISGSYTLGPECALKISSFGGSKVGEPEWSRKAWFPSDSSASGFYSVSSDKLVIRFGKSPEQFVFKREK